jgi:hypothetical protein
MLTLVQNMCYLEDMTTRIGIAGDWHGNLPWALAQVTRFASEGITEVLHLGDFGLLDDEEGLDYLGQLNAALTKNHINMLVTLGNHENFWMVDAMQPIQDGEFAGWLTYDGLTNLLFASRGQRWVREGVSFVSLGGANSINRFDLMENINWWAGEQISYGDVYNTIAGGPADVFIAHDCPAGVELFGDNKGDDGSWSVEAMNYAAHSRDSLRVAVDAVKPGILFHGHYHHYLDQTTTLVDGEGEGYNLRTIGMDKDGSENNIGILDLPSQVFTVI